MEQDAKSWNDISSPINQKHLCFCALNTKTMLQLCEYCSHVVWKGRWGIGGEVNRSESTRDDPGKLSHEWIVGMETCWLLFAFTWLLSTSVGIVFKLQKTVQTGNGMFFCFAVIYHLQTLVKWKLRWRHQRTMKIRHSNDFQIRAFSVSPGLNLRRVERVKTVCWLDENNSKMT